jgi:phage-related protein
VAVDGLAVASVGAAGAIGIGLTAAVGLAAVKFALMAKGVSDTWKKLGTDLQAQTVAMSGPVQNALLGIAEYARSQFAKLRPTIRALFTDLKPVVGELGTGFVAAGAAAVRGLEPFIRMVRPLVDVLAANLVPIVTALGQALTNIVGPLARNSAAFGQFIGLITQLLPALGGVIGNLVTLGAQVLPLLTPVLDTVLSAVDGLLQLLGRLGAQILPALAGTLRDVAGSLYTGLAKVLPVVGKALQTMLPAIGRLAQALFPALAQILTALEPVLANVVSTLANSLAKVLPGLVPGFVALISVVGGLFGAVKPLLPQLTYLALWITKVTSNLLGAILPVVAAILQALMPALKGLLPVIITVVNTVGNALAAAFTQAQPALVSLARSIGLILVALTPLIPVIVKAAMSFLPLIPAIAKVAAGLAQGLVPIVLALTPLLIALAPTLVKIAIAAKLWAGVQALLNIVLAANPIGLVIVAIAALAAGIIYAYKHSATFRAIVQAAFHAVQVTVQAVVGWFTGTFVPFFTRTIPGAFNAVLSWVRSHWPLLLSILTGPIGAATIYIIRHWDQIRQGAVTAWNAVVDFIKRIPGRIIGALGNLGGLLYGKGKDVLNGMLNGIKAVWETVRGWFRGMPSAILRALGIKSPPDWAIDAGRHVMNGILKGLAHGASNVKGFFVGLAGNVLGPLKNIWSTISGGLGAFAGPVLGKFSSIVDLAKAMLTVVGWGSGPAWNAFYNLEMGEAGFNPFARNPSSGAYGIAQALPPSKYPPGAFSTNPMTAAAVQIAWMIDYIRGRYGDPIRAYSAWLSRSPHWYAGGLAPTLFTRPTLIGVGERGPEVASVVPLGRGGRSAGGVYVDLRGAVVYGDRRALVAEIRKGIREGMRAEGKPTQGI